MLKEKLAALLALQQLDSALAALQRQYAALDHGAKERSALESAQAAHAEAESRLHTTTAELKDTEFEPEGCRSEGRRFREEVV